MSEHFQPEFELAPGISFMVDPELAAFLLGTNPQPEFFYTMGELDRTVAHNRALKIIESKHYREHGRKVYKESARTLDLGGRGNVDASTWYNYIGQLGEVAVSKYFSWPLTPIRARGGDNGADFMVNRYMIDVKTRDRFPHVKHRYGDLQIPMVQLNRFEKDIYILCHAYPYYVGIVGWASRRQLLDGGRELQQRTATWSYERGDLNPMHELLPAIQNRKVDEY